MNKFIFTTFFAAFLTFGCNPQATTNSQITDSVTQAYPTSVNDQITDSVTQSQIKHLGSADSVTSSQFTDQSTTGNVSDFPPHQDPLDQSSANYITYHTKYWSLAASEDWFTSKARIPYTDLSLVNRDRGMLFTLLSEPTDKTLEEYVTTQQKYLQNLGVKDVTLEKVKVGNVDYLRLHAPDANYNNWQWVSVQNKLAHVWGCGSPKGIIPSYEACLNLVISSAPKNSF